MRIGALGESSFTATATISKSGDNATIGMTRLTALSAVRPIPRRGLSREEAAMYVGISANKFDELVRDGRMLAPKRIDGRKVWDIRDLDVAFDALPGENPHSHGSSWDDFRDL